MRGWREKEKTTGRQPLVGQWCLWVSRGKWWTLFCNPRRVHLCPEAYEDAKQRHAPRKPTQSNFDLLRQAPRARSLSHQALRNEGFGDFAGCLFRTHVGGTVWGWAVHESFN